MAEYYKEKIASNDDVEMVLYSLDSDEDGLGTFMEKHQAPWPAIDFGHLKRAKAVGKFRPKGIPHYELIDAEGNSVASGLSAAKRKIESLSAGDS